MRFHMGVSFRLKSLKKFIIPFLIGLLSYFGLSSFNIMKVHAYSNTNTFYRYQYDEIDWNEIQTNGDFSFQDILNITQIPSDYYWVDSYIVRLYNPATQVNNYTLQIYLIPKNLNLQSTLVYNYGYYYERYYISYSYVSSISHLVQWNGTLNATLTTEQLELYYSKYYDCLTENNCDSNYFATTTDKPNHRIDNFGTISNNSSYTINFKDYLFDNTTDTRFMPYYTNIPTKWYGIPNNTTTSQFYKKISINGVGVSANDDFKHYCDFYDCSVVDDNIAFNNFSTKFETLYAILDNNLNSNLFSIYYKVPNAEVYTEKIDKYVNLFYGRIDHGTYYSYEKINCSILFTDYSDISNNVIYYTLDHVSCSNVDLTRYDKLFLYHTIQFKDEDIDKTISELNIGTIQDYQYSRFRGFIYEKFDIPNNYNYLFSSNGDNSSKIYFSSNDTNVSYDIISLDPNNDTLVSRNSILSCSVNYSNLFTNFGYCDYDFGSHVYNFNILISNIGTEQNDSYLILFLSDDNIIISYGLSGDNFYYYNSQNELTQSSLSFTFQEKYIENDYNSLNSFFSSINSYINGINNDLANLHNIINNIYISIPISYRYPLDIFYIIGLIYIIYREIKR